MLRSARACFLIFSAAVFLLNCSGPSGSDHYASLALQIHLAPGRAWSKFSDFDCLAVNVVGPGVSPVAAAPQQSTMASIYGDDSVCTYPGALSDMVPMPTSGTESQTLSVRVPSGSGRVIQLLGIVLASGDTCHSAAQTPSKWSSLRGIFELGRAKGDLTAEGQVVPISADYMEGTNREIRCEATIPSTAFCTKHATGSPYADGDGSSGNPFTLCTSAQFNSLVNSGSWSNGVYYSLRSDITLPTGVATLGDGTTDFGANFDGNNFRLTYGKRSPGASGQQGLFGVLGATATVEDLIVTGEIEGTGTEYGILAGRSDGATVTNCSATGSVSGGDKVGGAIGYVSAGSINTLTSIATVNCSAGDCGGLVGLFSGNLDSSRATGAVTSSSSNNVGGLLGQATGTITKCAASGVVLSGGAMVGGLIGYSNNAQVSSSYATGNVRGYSEVGGFVGRKVDTSSYSNNYSWGDVKADSGQAGGFLGQGTSSPSPGHGLSDCYTSATSVEGTTVGAFAVGGFTAGTSDGLYSNSAVTSTVGGTVTGMALSTGDMKLKASFAEFNFTTDWNDPTATSFPTLKGGVSVDQADLPCAQGETAPPIQARKITCTR